MSLVETCAKGRGVGESGGRRRGLPGKSWPSSVCAPSVTDELVQEEPWPWPCLPWGHSAGNRVTLCPSDIKEEEAEARVVQQQTLISKMD